MCNSERQIGLVFKDVTIDKLLHALIFSLIKNGNNHSTVSCLQRIELENESKMTWVIIKSEKCRFH